MRTPSCSGLMRRGVCCSVRASRSCAPRLLVRFSGAAFRSAVHGAEAVQAAAGRPIPDSLPPPRMKPRLLFVSNLSPDQAEPYRGLDNATILHHLRDRWDIQVIAPRPALSAWWGRAGAWQPRPEDKVFLPQFLSVPYVPPAGSFWNHRLMASKLSGGDQARRPDLRLAGGPGSYGSIPRRLRLGEVGG